MPTPANLGFPPASQYFRGETWRVVVTLAVVPMGGIAGWSCALSIKLNLADTNPAFTTPATVSDPTQGVIVGVVPESYTTTLVANVPVFYDVCRVDIGYREVLAFGQILPSQACSF